MADKELALTLIRRIRERSARVGIIGLGYVGLPLGIAFAKAGFPLVGFDVDGEKVDAINAGKSYITHITGEDVAAIATRGGFATTDSARLAEADVILICVPTPLTKQREPDMTFVTGTAEMLSRVMRPGQLYVLESTTYPGTTREVLLPVLERSGLRGGVDFLLAYSPEREDPGNGGHSAKDIPKVVGGLTGECLDVARELYGAVTPSTVPVSTLETAEATKLMENIFRCVNIAMVNELKVVFTKMGIDVWEVIEAAKTKPFGFMPFFPGPGLGGHCIPIDPFYLSWKAREFDCATRFIELAGEVNTAMPEYVITKCVEALNEERKSLNGSRVLVVGLAYKKDVDDTRETPSLRIMELLMRFGATVEYHDPFIPQIPKVRAYEYRMDSVPLTRESVARYDIVLISTDHTGIDYAMLGECAHCIVDTRNTMARFGETAARVVKA